MDQDTLRASMELLEKSTKKKHLELRSKIVDKDFVVKKQKFTQ